MIKSLSTYGTTIDSEKSRTGEGGLESAFNCFTICVSIVAAAVAGDDIEQEIANNGDKLAHYWKEDVYLRK